MKILFMFLMMCSVEWSLTQTEETFAASQPKYIGEVTMYSASWCGPCNSAKAWFKKHPEIKLNVVDTDRESYPGWVQSLPTFEWNDPDGNTYSLVGGSSSVCEKIRKRFVK